MIGYNPDFLGIHLALPTFTVELVSELVNKGEAFHYPNYSVIMNGHVDKRSASIVCLNIDQNKFKKTSSGRWRTDKRIDAEYQLDNDYYYQNPWDRGHLARRATASWGESKREAQHRSSETYYYSNCSLQHANVNQDEWLDVLEEWVKALDLAKGGLITSMSGPFYGEYDRSIRPSGRRVALIPSGFFKVVCFINKHTNALDVRAFVMYQDEEAIADKEGGARYNNQHYQVTITEVERLTGLRFDDRVYAANPLFASADNADASLNINADRMPEHIEVARPDDMVSANTVREEVVDEDIDVYVAAAMVNPEGSDKGNEWVSIINFENDEVDFSGWRVMDKKGGTVQIDQVVTDPKQRIIASGQALVVNLTASMRLGNKGGVIKLYNASNQRVDWVNYTQNMVVPGQPVLFLSPRDTLK